MFETTKFGTYILKKADEISKPIYILCDYCPMNLKSGPILWSFLMNAAFAFILVS